MLILVLRFQVCPAAGRVHRAAETVQKCLPQSAGLKPALAVVEQKITPACTCTVKEIRSMVEHFKAVPDFRRRFESYPLWSMLTICAA
jgi:hypothetical protein